MNQESLKNLVKHGLTAMKAGSMVAEKATSEIIEDATNPMLKEKLEEGNKQSKMWATRIDSCLKEVGAVADKNNRILEAHFEVSKEIRSNAKDEYSRDLGIIASGQMALHYWIASFGTVRSYAEQLGFDQTAKFMESCLSEAKAADTEMSDVASQIMGGQNQKVRVSQASEMRMQ